MFQVELHPYLAQSGLLRFCNANDIKLTAYSPLGRPGQHKGGPLLLEDQVVTDIAKQRGLSPGQVVLAWGVGRGYAVIPKSATLSRIAANLAAGRVVLTSGQIAALDALDKDHHFCNYPWARGGSGLYERSIPNC